MKNYLHFLIAIIIFIGISACSLAPQSTVSNKVNPSNDLVIKTIPFEQQSCSDTFVTHTLDHITTPSQQPIQMFDSNGAGLAINDLDNDGDLDLVLANLAGPNTVLWNDGGLVFRKTELDHGDSRAVNTVDVDADGWLDIVFTLTGGGVSYWHNHQGTFEAGTLPGVLKPAYAMTWADLDNDHDLDLITGSYDALLLKKFGSGGMPSQTNGVYVYENEAGNFEATRLADEAQTLALITLDLNQDNRLDILVGNDFVVRDQAWLQTDTDWTTVEPFANTTHSTMSFDMGDVNNDGHWELFATDMKPYAEDEATLAQWQPVMDMMTHGHTEGDPQVMENVFQMADAEGEFENQANQLGLTATGWSWSAKFGDLDQDGFLDIYVVNGMTAEELFGHLPGDELVEENQAFRNVAGRSFEAVPDWGLNGTSSGRGMSLGDLDNDGDLDIVINNLNTPAQILENKLCGGHSLSVDLKWPASQNRFALNAEVHLHTSTGRYSRVVKASSGYLSGDPTRLHFGFPAESNLEYLEIHWPDGIVSKVDGLTAETLLLISRDPS